MNRQLQPKILCFSTTDWDGVWGSRQQIMLRFARRGYKVLFIERPVGLEHLARHAAFRQRKWRRWREGMRQIEPGLWIASLPPLLPGRYYSAAINKINHAWATPFVAHWLRQLNLQNPILWVYPPESATLLGRFGESLRVYHCIDEWTAGQHGRKRETISRLERQLLTQVDLVFANSQPTFEAKRLFNSHTYRIPSGVDLTRFMPTQRPLPHPTLTQIPRPCIGYSGHVNERLNYDILYPLAAKTPHWSFVFVGDTYPWTPKTQPLAHLLSLPNVHYLEKQPFSDMPAILQAFDVCLMPYVDDERGYYRSPLKLYEYLALGKPVVSNWHPEGTEFADLIYLADTPDTFASAVQMALDESPALCLARQTSARQHSWEVRVNEMEKQILARWQEINSNAAR